MAFKTLTCPGALPVPGDHEKRGRPRSASYSQNRFCATIAIRHGCIRRSALQDCSLTRNPKVGTPALTESRGPPSKSRAMALPRLAGSQATRTCRSISRNSLVPDAGHRKSGPAKPTLTRKVGWQTTLRGFYVNIGAGHSASARTACGESICGRFGRRHADRTAHLAASVEPDAVTRVCVRA